MSTDPVALARIKRLVNDLWHEYDFTLTIIATSLANKLGLYKKLEAKWELYKEDPNRAMLELALEEMRKYRMAFEVDAFVIDKLLKLGDIIKLMKEELKKLEEK